MFYFKVEEEWSSGSASVKEITYVLYVLLIHLTLEGETGEDWFCFVFCYEPRTDWHWSIRVPIVKNLNIDSKK